MEEFKECDPFLMYFVTNQEAGNVFLLSSI